MSVSSVKNNSFSSREGQTPEDATVSVMGSGGKRKIRYDSSLLERFSRPLPLSSMDQNEGERQMQSLSAVNLSKVSAQSCVSTSLGNFF